MGAKSSAGVLGALREVLPARRRTDAVLAIEYLVTASPEFFKDAGLKTTHTRAGFFNAALEFLRQKHGKQNVISAALHMDETTPHLVAYVVPLNAAGKLCAKDYLGGKDKLVRLQTDFFEQVGSKFELARGIQGSRATHQAVKRFYSQIDSPAPLMPLSSIDKIADLLGFKTSATSQREGDEMVLLAHGTAHSASALLNIKNAQKRAHTSLLAERGRSQALANSLEKERKKNAEIETQLQSANERITQVQRQAAALYDRNQQLQLLNYPPDLSTNLKVNNVSQNRKSGLAP